MGCKECGKPKCNGECGCKSPKVLQINNPAEYITFHKVSIPAAMGDSTTNPPKIGAYRNALVYYEADHTSWMYSTDGIPTKLTNGLTDYNEAVNLPQINGHTLIGDQSSSDLGLQGELTAGTNIQINGNVISATDTTYTAGNGIELDGTEIKAKIGDGLEFGNNGEINIADIEQYAHFFDMVADMKAADLSDGEFAVTAGYYAANDGGGALYKIRNATNDDVIDEATIIEMGDGSDRLIAELIVEDYVTPEMLGAYGDDTHDDTSIFNILFSKFLNIKLGANKTYKITETLTFPNNVKLEGCGTTSILKSYITNGSPVLQNLTNVSHFIIKNFYIQGNNDNSYGILVQRPYDNCVIEGIYFSHLYKSAIKIGTTATISQSLVIQNCTVYASETETLTEPMFDIYKCFECNILNNKLLGHQPAPSNIALLQMSNIIDANIQGNSFAHVAGTGIRINSDSNGDSRNNRIISNTYENITGSYSIELIGTSGHEVSSTIVVEANTYYNAPRLIHCEYENQGMFIGIDSEGGRRNLVIDNNSNKVTEAYQNTFVTADNKTLCMSGIGLQGYDKKIRYRAVVNDSANNDYGMQITDKRNTGWKLEIQKGYMGNDLAGNRFKVKSPDGTITKYIGIDNNGDIQAFNDYIR